jgi:hypothetical protein
MWNYVDEPSVEAGLLRCRICRKSMKDSDIRNLTQRLMTIYRCQEADRNKEV